eukprot:gnl/TRDRNA2_/TRDRNA2_171630_c0_seq5.p1 gnl/TRDRNA2_/TRDRNA2_171630_c0~~gnl/TRDRNA2_/TRDRNA2_171630_c0_seq5.p1  ORF type:complete len:406 (-),score=73.10 gnl/TRDRNA2_/TRDRNA2_171630_c0_seq5:361-1548(-)
MAMPASAQSEHVQEADHATKAFMAGQKFLGAGDAESALPCFMQAAAAAQSWPDAWLRLGMCLHHLRRYAQSCAAMRRGLDVGNWEDPPAVLTFMDALRDLGRLGEVEASARHVPEGPFRHFAALLAGGATQAKAGASAAAGWFAIAAAAEPENILYAYLHAQAVNGGCPVLFEPPSGCPVAALCRPSEAQENLTAFTLALECDELFVQLHRAQNHLDAPSLRQVNDKVELHRLLAASNAAFWPRGFVLPGERAVAEEAEASDDFRSCGGEFAPRWVCKRRNAMGGLGVTVHVSVAAAASSSSTTSSADRESEKAQHQEESLLQATWHEKASQFARRGYGAMDTAAMMLVRISQISRDRRCPHPNWSSRVTFKASMTLSLKAGLAVLRRYGLEPRW